MGLSDWIISTSAGTIAILLAFSAYFAQKWIQGIDEKIKEHSNDLRDVSKQISSFQSAQSSQAANYAKAIQSKISTFSLPYTKIDAIQEEINELRSFFKEKMLPRYELLQENNGKIVVLESSAREQNNKINTMFNALKVLAAKTKPDQK